MNNNPNNKPRPDRPQSSGGNRAPKSPLAGSLNSSRGAAIRAQRRSQEMAQGITNEYLDAGANKLERRANVIADDQNKLKITFLGGQDGIGEKNMQIFEWGNSAIVLDCGNDLGLDLPGINYAVADPSYLESIRHKLKGYVVSHGHLDHVGGLKHIVPRIPAPIYGSRFTIGVVEKTFEEMPPDTDAGFTPKTVIMNMDGHERLKLGDFTVELVRITHSIPEASCIVVDTPVGRIIQTGDYRLDPEPLDEKPSDTERLKQLGDEGVLALLGESTYAWREGRTPTEHTLQQSFHDIIGATEGRVLVAVFSSNMNRVQMIVNAAVAAGRRVALDGRSMMAYAEIAVRQGILKVPKGTVLAMRDIATIPDRQVLVICTGGQGEPGAALQRMSTGDHKHINLHEGDTVVISSNPIPGNEVRYEEISNDLVKKGVHLFRNPFAEVDRCGPLHVGGHAWRGEYRDMLKLTRPKFVIPIYAGASNRKYHSELIIEEGWARQNVILVENGESLLFTADKWERGGQVPHGIILVDQTASVVPSVVVKDRIMLADAGLVAVVLTVDKKTGQLLTSPDIISRGFIYMRDNEELMNTFRTELKRAVTQRFKRVDLDRFKLEIKEHVMHFLYEHTQRSPIVIPVVNVIGGKHDTKTVVAGGQAKGAEQQAIDQQRRFQEMRARLLGQDQPD